MNEFELIQNYFNWPLSDSTIELGIGDDAAIFDLDSGYQLVTSTDTFSEGVHFFKDTSPEDIAYKSLAVNLSDIAAMGATAKYFTLAITLPKLDETWLEHFSKSLKEASKKYNVSLIGGDTTRGALNITITMMGVVEKSKAIKRSGAMSGDNIYLSGEIGDAALNELRHSFDVCQELERHLRVCKHNQYHAFVREHILCTVKEHILCVTASTMLS